MPTLQYDHMMAAINGVHVMDQTRQLYEFAESYDKYPDIASNIAVDAEEQGEPEGVVMFFEMLGDTYVEDKDQVVGMIAQLDDDMPSV